MSEKRIKQPETLYTLHQVAELLKLSCSTVARLKARGDLPCVKIGRSVRVEASAIARLIEESKHADHN